MFFICFNNRNSIIYVSIWRSASVIYLFCIINFFRPLLSKFSEKICSMTPHFYKRELKLWGEKPLNGWKLKVFFLMSRNSKPFFNIVYFPNDITEAHYFTYRTQNVVSQMILDVFLGILIMTLLMQDGFTESISTQFFMWTEVRLKQ
jgi:hypothetical protein